MRVILATASWKSLWMNWSKSVLRRDLIDAIITENIIECLLYVQYVFYNSQLGRPIYIYIYIYINKREMEVHAWESVVYERRDYPRRTTLIWRTCLILFFFFGKHVFDLLSMSILYYYNDIVVVLLR